MLRVGVLVMCEIERPVVFSPVRVVRGVRPRHTDIPEGPGQHGVTSQ